MLLRTHLNHVIILQDVGRLYCVGVAVLGASRL